MGAGEGPKPTTSEPCNTDACPTWSWLAGDFSPCSLACGGGIQSRSVVCVFDATGAIVDDAFCANAVLDSNATGTDRTGDSLRRIDKTDDHDEADWAQGASTWGLIHPGQTTF